MSYSLRRAIGRSAGETPPDAALPALRSEASAKRSTKRSTTGKTDRKAPRSGPGAGAGVYPYETEVGHTLALRRQTLRRLAHEQARLYQRTGSARRRAPTHREGRARRAAPHQTHLRVVVAGVVAAPQAVSRARVVGTTTRYTAANACSPSSKQPDWNASTKGRSTNSWTCWLNRSRPRNWGRRPRTMRWHARCLSQRRRQGKTYPTQPGAGDRAFPADHVERDYLRMHEIPRYLESCSDLYRPLAEVLLRTACGYRRRSRLR